MDQQTQQSRTRAVWRQLLNLRREAPLVHWFLVIWVLAEVTSAALGPLVIPDHVYLSLYLGNQARQNTRDFYCGKSQALVFDAECGWRNRPNYEREKWRIDEHGSRSTQAISITRNAKTRVLFLGSSLTNGGMSVSAGETISAAIEDSTTETLNFATMLYSLDQCYLAYRARMRKFAADFVVVGLSGNPTEGLTNRYVPYRVRTEIHMPYFKPRFGETEGELKLHTVPSPEEALTVLDSPDLLDRIGRSDGYAANFSGFKRFDQTPITHALWSLGVKFRNLHHLLQKSYSELDLLQALMGAMVATADEDGAPVVFMFLPDQDITWPGLRGRLPDHYSDMIARLRAAGFTILDGRQVLLDSGERPSRLYHRDGQHYSALGNRVIGASLKPLLAQPTELN